MSGDVRQRTHVLMSFVLLVLLPAGWVNAGTYTPSGHPPPGGAVAHPLNDTTPPNVTIISPANGSVVTGSVPVLVNASDDVGVDRVEFYLDTNLVFITNQTPYVWEWNTWDSPNGTHTINATGYDAAGNLNWSEVSVVVANDRTPPLVVILAPSEGATITGDVDVVANASDVGGNISMVVFQVDGGTRHTDTSPQGPYIWRWNASGEPGGPHTITVLARDSAGNNASSSVNVTVDVRDITPPTVRVTTPASGSTVYERVYVNVEVSDDMALARIEIFLDGRSVYVNGSGSNGVYTWIWDTTTTVNGVHELNATAQDAAGNTGWNTSVVIVSNIVAPTIDSPRKGETVMGTILISGRAESMVRSVEVRIDGSEWAVADGTATWKIFWNTTKVVNGAHMILVRGSDGFRYSPTANITVMVDNPEATCTILTPVEGSTVSGDVNISGSASRGTAWVEVRIDGSNWTKATGTTAWYIYWDTASETDGPHRVSVRAYNSVLGIYSPEVGVNVTVDNPEEKRPAIDPQVAGGVVTLLILVMLLGLLYSVARRRPDYRDEEDILEGAASPESDGRRTRRRRTGPGKGKGRR